MRSVAARIQVIELGRTTVLVASSSDSSLLKSSSPSLVRGLKGSRSIVIQITTGTTNLATCAGRRGASRTTIDDKSFSAAIWMTLGKALTLRESGASWDEGAPTNSKGEKKCVLKNV